MADHTEDPLGQLGSSLRTVSLVARDKGWEVGDSTVCYKSGPGFKGQLGGRSFVICTTNWLVNRKTE